MRWTTLSPAVSAAALALALAAPATAAVSDFRLPEAGRQPAPDRQGPVVPDVPASRVQPTPAPTSRPAPTPAPSPTAAAPTIVVPDLSEATPRPVASRTAPPADGAARPRAATSAPTVAGVAETPTQTTGAVPGLPPPSAVANAPTAAALAPQDEVSLWTWILAALAGLGLLGGAGFVWRRWRQVAGKVAVTPVERPQPARAPSPAPRPQPATAAPAEPLQVTLEPLRLSLTLMNATLAYRLEIANRGLAPVAALRIGADMIAAHASMSREQQLSGPGNDAPTVQRIERLEPGESRVVEGEFRVPFSQIVPIRQGNAALLLPLARFRLEADGTRRLVRTFVVGQPGNGSGLQPFRLDLGPRIYPKLAQHAFA